MFKPERNLKLVFNYILIAVAFLVLGFVVYIYNAKKSVEKVSVGEVLPVNEQIKPDTLSNPFDFNQAVIGDVSSGFEIVKISSYNGDQIPLIDNLSIVFKNKKMVFGQVEEYSAGPLQGKICLHNDDPYAQKTLPRIVGDSRLLFFCFNNTTEAKKLLTKNNNVGLNVVIENYTINLNNGDAINTADLVE